MAKTTRSLSRIGLQLVGAVAITVGGLGLAATADASTCATDQLAGVCLPLESAPTQPKLVSFAQGDLCDQISGVCRTPDIRSIETAQPTQVRVDYSPTYETSCDQFSGVCAVVPSTKTERAQQGADSSDL